MYIISDVVVMGEAHEIILSDIKCDPVVDDSEPMTTTCEEIFESCD